MKKQWLIERSRVFEIQPKPGDTWEKLFLVPELKPGQFRSFPGEWLNGRFSDDPRSFAGFPCPACNCSVRTGPLISDPQIHVFGCSCTGVVIREPFGPIRQWHWSVFVGSVQVAQDPHTHGQQNIAIAGTCNDDQHS